MASRIKRSVPVTVNDVLEGHVKLTVDWLDRLYLHGYLGQLWMLRMVLLAMGLQTCGLHPDSSQSWPYCGRVSLSRPPALVSPSGSPV